MKKWALPVIMILLLAAIAGCGSTGNNNDPGDQPGQDFIVIESPEAGEIEISVADLMELESISQEIIRKDDNGNTVDQYPIKGVLLEKVLAHLNISSENLNTVRVTAGDGYSVEVPNNILASRKVILAYEIDGEHLQGNTRPIRVFIPEEETMYWVRNTVKISLTRGVSGGKNPPAGETTSLDTLIFFDTLVSTLESVDYTAEAGAKAVKASELYENVQATSLVNMLASDGFKKNEEYSTVVGGYIVYQGENAPAFRDPDLPRGMHVRDLVWMTSGDTGFVFFGPGLDYFETAEFDGNVGVSLKDLVEQIGLKLTDTYVIESVDGYTVEINYDDLEAGIVFFRESGELSTFFEGLPKNTGVKDLLSIRAGE